MLVVLDRLDCFVASLLAMTVIAFGAINTVRA
jgi:hypothetical protein